MTEIKKLYKTLLLKQKQQSLINDLVSLYGWPFTQILKGYCQFKTFFFVPRNVAISNSLIENKILHPF